MQTIRVSTQPFPQFTRGHSKADALVAFRRLCRWCGHCPLAPATTPAAVIASIVGDVATLAVKWDKPLAVRLLPAPGRNVGGMTEFSGQLANATIQPLPGSPRR